MKFMAFSDKVTLGAGDIFHDGNPPPKIGTYASTLNTLAQDLNGDGAVDRAFTWDDDQMAYIIPGGDGTTHNGLTKIEFEFIGEVDGVKIWRWKEYRRPSKYSNWGTRPDDDGIIKQRFP